MYLRCTAIASDAEAAILRHTVPASSSGSFNQLPLSVEQTVTDDTTQSQDRPMDYSVTSRWTQSAETVVNGNATVTRGSTQRSTAFVITDHFGGLRRAASPMCVCLWPRN